MENFLDPKSTANGKAEWEIARKRSKGKMQDSKILVKAFTDGTR